MVVQSMCVDGNELDWIGNRLNVCVMRAAEPPTTLFTFRDLRRVADLAQGWILFYGYQFGHSLIVQCLFRRTHAKTALRY